MYGMLYGMESKLTVRIDDELLHRLKVVAVGERKTVTEIVRGLIEGYLGGAPAVVADAQPRDVSARTVQAVPAAPVIPSASDRVFRGPDPKGGKK